MMGVTLLVTSLFTGSAPSHIHIVCFPCHVPAPWANCSCFFPGVLAAMHACISSAVHPGGSFISGAAAAAPAAGFFSFAGSAPIIMNAKTNIDAKTILFFMFISFKS
jgi:hypothetical protein